MDESVFKCLSPRSVALALTAALLLAQTVGPAGALTAPAVSGRAAVVDGDTLDVAGTRVRLEGIDAPEQAQKCARQEGLGTWDCGVAARRHLADLIAGKLITCESRGRDAYGRMLGLCRAGDIDLNEELVRSGLAWAFIKYSNSYVEAEAVAKQQRIGIWQGQTEPAWEYRDKRWKSAELAAPDGCAIKGNISNRGSIYHMPWSAWYRKVRVEPAKGERWFCSEADALAAGWRPVIVN